MSTEDDRPAPSFPRPRKEAPLRPFTVTRFRRAAASPSSETDLLAVEAAFTLHVEEVGSFTIMCSPSDLRALAAGFAFSENLISSTNDILSLAECGNDPLSIRMKLRSPTPSPSGRTLVVTGSCGICGSDHPVERFFSAPPAAPDTLRIPPQAPASALQAMEALQETYSATGGTHAAALFDRQNRLLSFAEDIGRHNALDKALGKLLLETGPPPEGTWCVISSRLSFELAAKAARAGLEMLVGVSAPSSLAVETARAAGVTLASLSAKGRLSVFSHPRRIAPVRFDTTGETVQVPT